MSTPVLIILFVLFELGKVAFHFGIIDLRRHFVDNLFHIVAVRVTIKNNGRTVDEQALEIRIFNKFQVKVREAAFFFARIVSATLLDPLEHVDILMEFLIVLEQ